MRKIIYILSIMLFTTAHAYNMEDFEFYTEACKRNDYVSCSHLAIIYEENIIVKQDMKKAFNLYSKACGGDYAFACHNVAVTYSKSNNQALKDIALKFYDKACDGGYTESCIHLGRLHRDSHTLNRDYKKAKEYFAKACEGNNRLGCKEERILEESGY
ncbi:TPR repeat protein [Sulfurimonas gotlandica GD1]|uniref:beta-lactamase n=1 Tax=Sulfurimonas gotlandica (strain DSM 19862 / JCM 16533 / GD1) TaxID=929558 RepID=B6BNX6_SULGG|nr:tetratricopeptide repeat protein [Sulfurimonas gotlandica]EDZ61265.1 cysteine-rich protein C [Sulfurimonas gotlandica GD1]EHP28931.1 TPR repeat protein [Sulfurimonas gotlandica GD1]